MHQRCYLTISSSCQYVVILSISHQTDTYVDVYKKHVAPLLSGQAPEAPKTAKRGGKRVIPEETKPVEKPKPEDTTKKSRKSDEAKTPARKRVPATEQQDIQTPVPVAKPEPKSRRRTSKVQEDKEELLASARHDPRNMPRKELIRYIEGITGRDVSSSDFYVSVCDVL